MDGMELTTSWLLITCQKFLFKAFFSPVPKAQATYFTLPSLTLTSPALPPILCSAGLSPPEAEGMPGSATPAQCAFPEARVTICNIFLYIEWAFKIYYNRKLLEYSLKTHPNLFRNTWGCFTSCSKAPLKLGVLYVWWEEKLVEMWSGEKKGIDYMYNIFATPPQARYHQRLKEFC